MIHDKESNNHYSIDIAREMEMPDSLYAKWESLFAVIRFLLFLETVKSGSIMNIIR